MTCPTCGHVLHNLSAGCPDGASIVCPECDTIVTQGSGGAQLPLSEADVPHPPAHRHEPTPTEAQ
jgi:hypothetical protein